MMAPLSFLVSAVRLNFAENTPLDDNPVIMSKYT